MTTEKYGRSKKYNRVYGNPVKTPIGRFSWPYLSEPKVGELNGKVISNYEVQLLIDKSSPELQEFQVNLQTMANEMLELYNKYAPAKLAGVDVFKDGDGYDHEKYPYYANTFVLATRNSEKPKVLNATKAEITPDTITPGVKGRLVVIPHLGPTGISYRVERVQFLEDDGVRFGGGKRDYDGLLDAIEGESTIEEQAEELERQETAPEPTPAAPINPAQLRAQARGGRGKNAAVDIL